MEKNHELYPHEEELLCRIFDEIEAGNLSILISGPKGVGKTYVTEKYLGSQDINTYLAIKFNGENAVDQESYFVLKEGLSSKVGKQIKTERMQDISMLVRESGIKVPFLGAFVDFFHSSHKRSFDNFYYKYDSTAKDIIFKLKYLAERKELIIICYGLENWDRMSLKLLYNILNSRNEDFSFLSSTIIICTCSSEKTENIDIIQAIKNSSGVKEIPTYINEDQFESLVSNIYPDGKFDNRPLGYLHKITEGNIPVLKNIFDCIKDGYDIDENHVSDSLSIVKEFIYNKIKTEFPSDDSIKASMEIGALLGLFFFTNELQEVVGWDDGKFQAEIEHAVEMGLVNRNWTDGDGDKIRFVHNVIRQAFKFGGKALSIEYNQKIASALSIIAPNQYKRRSSFEESSKQYHKAAVLKLLSLIQSYKRKEKPDYKDRETTFIFVSDYYPSLWKYYEFIENGYASYNNDIYDDSLSSVSFEGAPIELRVERAILYSMICTKNRDFAARDKGITMLEPFSKSVESCGSELFLYEQVLMRMVVLYAHSGEIKRARELEEKLVASLMQRINTDNSATHMLYSLHRISNALYDSEVALHKIHSSMQC